MSNAELEEKLLELEKLEIKYGFLGISMQVRDGVSISTKGSIDCAIDFYRRTIELIERLREGEDGSVFFAH